MCAQDPAGQPEQRLRPPRPGEGPRRIPQLATKRSKIEKVTKCKKKQKKIYEIPFPTRSFFYQLKKN